MKVLLYGLLVKEGQFFQVFGKRLEYRRDGDMEKALWEIDAAPNLLKHMDSMTEESWQVLLNKVKSKATEKFSPVVADITQQYLLWRGWKSFKEVHPEEAAALSGYHS